jgi:hypothetical protein
MDKSPRSTSLCEALGKVVVLSSSSLHISRTADIEFAQEITIENVDVVHLVYFVWFGGIRSGYEGQDFTFCGRCRDRTYDLCLVRAAL